LLSADVALGSFGTGAGVDAALWIADELAARAASALAEFDGVEFCGAAIVAVTIAQIPTVARQKAGRNLQVRMISRQSPISWFDRLVRFAFA